MDQRIIDKILPYLEIDTDDCINYPVLDCDGYGSYQYMQQGRKKHHRIHRAVFAYVHKIELSKDDVIMHSCDNPACCNIKHLALGTHKDNCDDKVRKDRQAKGVRNGRYKHGLYSKYECTKPSPTFNRYGRLLTRDQVLLVKQTIFENPTMSLRRISDLIGISYSLIKDIRYGRSYVKVA